MVSPITVVHHGGPVGPGLVHHGGPAGPGLVHHGGPAGQHESLPGSCCCGGQYGALHPAPTPGVGLLQYRGVSRFFEGEPYCPNLRKKLEDIQGVSFDWSYKLCV